jgi:cyclic pyranopterin phosphate synthase
MTSSTPSHLDTRNRPRMVDVGGKDTTRRTARARAEVQLPEALAERFDGRDLESAKGPVFQSASLAGIMAAKKTAELIPLCHPLPLDRCQVDLEMGTDGIVTIEASASTDGRTGVEMEALTAASVAALTVYDMCKSLAPGIVIRRIGLLEKTGGKSHLVRSDLAQEFADPVR